MAKPPKPRKSLPPLPSTLTIHVSDEVLGKRLAKLIAPYLEALAREQETEREAEQVGRR
jgi:hypothetical protein